MNRSQINAILKLAQEFEQLSNPHTAPSDIFYRAQPIGKDLFSHTSGLAYEKVPGVFAFEDPAKIFDTYSWIHMKKTQIIMR